MSHPFDSGLCDDGIHPTPAGYNRIDGHIASFFSTVDTYVCYSNLKGELP